MSGRRASFVLAVLAVLALSGCRSVAPRLDPAEARAALESLGGPLSGHPVALYRLDAPASRALRLSLQTAPDGGRLAVSEPFGSALSILAWPSGGPPVTYDLRAGCRVQGGGLEDVLGVSALPVEAAVRLLAGRLPLPAAEMVLGPDGRLLARGDGWQAVVGVVPDPWRVVEVRDVERGWRVRLLEHRGEVPSRLKAGRGGLRRVELELVAMEWDTLDSLVPLPDLPVCPR